MTSSHPPGDSLVLARAARHGQAGREAATAAHRKIRLFRSGLTVEMLILVLVNVAVSTVIVWSGFEINESWLHRGDLFIAAGLVLCAATLGIMLRASGTRIEATPYGLSWDRGRRHAEVCWRDVRAVHTTAPGRRWLRRTVVVAPKCTIEISSQVYPEYDLLVNLILMARKHHQEKAYEI